MSTKEKKCFILKFLVLFLNEKEAERREEIFSYLCFVGRKAKKMINWRMQTASSSSLSSSRSTEDIGFVDDES